MSKLYIDLTVVSLYILGIVGFGLWVTKRQQKTSESYFLGNRQFTWPFVGMSLFATGISSMQFVGQAGLAYKIGIAASNPQLLGALMLGFSAIFFVPMFVQSKILTIPELLEVRYNRACKLIFSFTLVTLGVLGAPFGFYAGGLAVLELFKIDASYLWICCAVMGVAVAAYAVTGGLASMMIIDFVQGAILLLGGTIVLITGLIHLGKPGAELAPVPSTHYDLILPATNAEMPWTGVFSGLLIASLFFATTNAGLMQRVLAARDVYHARTGTVMAAMLKVVAVFVIVFPGIIAARLFPGINPDAAFPTMVNNLLPAGLSGLVLAGMIAALLSTADAGVNNLSSLITLNLYPFFAPRSSQANRLLVGRVSSILILVWSVAAAPFVASFGLIFPLTLKISAYLLGPVGVCYFFGRFSRRVNRQGAIAVLLLGYVIGLYLVLGTTFATLKPFVPDFVLRTNFYHVSAGLVACYSVILFAVSLFTAPPPAEQIAAVKLTWATAPGARRPFFQTFEFWCGLLFVAIAACYLIF